MQTWNEAATTTLGLFWTVFWAFGLVYLISSMIQVFVTRERMQQTMGETGPRSVALGSFFGFISSSCSFAALATTRALFVKGAGLIPSLAFLLASTNLVIELGIVIAVFLGWQFVVGEHVHDQTLRARRRLQQQILDRTRRESRHPGPVSLPVTLPASGYITDVDIDRLAEALAERDRQVGPGSGSNAIAHITVGMEPGRFLICIYCVPCP